VALCEGGWDINTLHLIYSEVQQIAGSAGGYGLVSASEKLFALEVYLSSFTESGLVPDTDQTGEIRRLVGDLDILSGGIASAPANVSADRKVTATVVSSAELPEPIIELNGLPATANVPTMVIPPLDFLPFDDAPVSPLGEISDEQDAFEFDESAMPEPDYEPGYVDPDIERLMDDEEAEISVGNIADQLVSDEDQLSILEGDDPGEAWMDDVRLVDTEDFDASEEADGEQDQQEDTLTSIHSAESTSLLDESIEDMELDDAEIDGLIESVSAITDETAESQSGASEANKTISLSKAKTAYFLRESNAITDTLVNRLEPEYEIHSFDDIEEFREILGALGPEVVMVDGSFIDAIEELSPLIKRIRSKQSGPMPMLAFSDENDVATRLKILRAGADAFFRTDTPAEQVRQRLGELLQARTEDPYRVMIVEDDRSQAMFAQSILKKAGMEVFIERNPLKIMDSLENFKPDLILMDLYMPDCDGIELTAIIRERDEFVNTPIVFLSGESDTDKHFDALLAGGDDFLAKPIRPRHLIQAVTNRVQRARMVQRRGSASVTRDSVTGLVDRPTLLERINALLADMDKVDIDLPGGVLYVEIDNPLTLRKEIGLTGFEELADTLAPILTEELGKGEVAGRYGDNAYCILIPNRSMEALSALANDLVTRVKKHIFEIEGSSRTATISVGICPLSNQLADAGAVIGAAERACNKKESGDDTHVALASSPVLQLDDSDQSDEELKPLIEEALEKRRFQVLFQPIVSLQGEHTEQYQSLLRLPGAEGRPVPAGRFIPVAERHGLITKIDRWIVSRALSVIDERSRNSRPVRLFVNQSGPTVEHKENLPWLSKLLETRGVNPEALVLEFKLPDIVQRLKLAVHYVNGIAEFGVHCGLGSFDGSDAAFQVLEHLNVRYVKLPPATGSDGLPNMNIKKVIKRLHDANKLVIIPSIEDAKTAARLWPTGVDFIQGNFVQPPESDLVYQF
jgi:diguanylate cyclase (GGDEF)-like protein